MYEYLKDSYSSPIVILQYGGTDIIHNGRDISKDITNFEYEYDIESGDSCLITFETEDVTLPDNEVFTDGTNLTVMWGYIEGNIKAGEKLESYLSPVKLLKVRDIKCQYSPTGLKMVLDCTDRVTYLRTHKQSNTFDEGLGDFFKKAMGGDFFEIYHDGWIYDSRKPSKVKKPDGTNTTTVDNTGIVKLLSRKLAVMSNGSVFYHIKKELDTLEGGPWFISSTDEKVMIKSISFAGTPKKTYDYYGEPGEVINFNPQSNNKRADLAGLISSDIDPDFKNISSDNSFIGQKANYSTISNSNGQVYEDLTMQFERQLGQYFTLVRGYYNGLLAGNKGPLPKFVIKLDTERPQTDEKQGNQINNVAVIDEAKRTINAVVDGSIVLVANQDYVNDLCNNLAAKVELEREIATLTIIGDPQLMVSHLLKIIGVAKRYTGLYYVVKCKHSISTGQGFITEMELLKKPKNDKLSEVKRIKKKVIITIDGNRQVIDESELQYYALKQALKDSKPDETGYREVLTNALRDIESKMGIKPAEDDGKDNNPVDNARFGDDGEKFDFQKRNDPENN